MAATDTLKYTGFREQSVDLCHHSHLCVYHENQMRISGLNRENCIYLNLRGKRAATRRFARKGFTFSGALKISLYLFADDVNAGRATLLNTKGEKC